ncbi:hypothetical protein P167DRAFT_163172 [Morchella conica CCBAS932]|uniref:Uncharacterized protein n=1 Tax=Morchella conica CCBAS932 TaxID=1392247 RepID=A0A3N4KPB9_9PEZI|nr:hypothetical protein P167DRAFT_163172 [Morchella conica CCBAS932]
MDARRGLCQFRRGHALCRWLVGDAVTRTMVRRIRPSHRSRCGYLLRFVLDERIYATRFLHYTVYYSEHCRRTQPSPGGQLLVPASIGGNHCSLTPSAMLVCRVCSAGIKHCSRLTSDGLIKTRAQCTAGTCIERSTERTGHAYLSFSLPQCA